MIINGQVNVMDTFVMDNLSIPTPIMKFESVYVIEFIEGKVLANYVEEINSKRLLFGQLMVRVS